MPVADDEAVAVHVGGKDDVKFGLGAGLESKVELLSVADDFFNHGAHLIDLNGKNDEVLGLKFILLGCNFEAFGRLFNPVVQNVGEAEQNGGRNVARGQLVHKLFQVNLYTVFLGTDINVSFFVDAEVTDAPSSDIVQFLGVLDSPFSHFANVAGCG